MNQDPAIDAYLGGLPADQRELLQRVRVQVAQLVPDAVEAISYGMPAFKLHGRFLVSYAGWKAHCSLYPLTDTFMKEYADDVTAFERTKGSIHFTPSAPLPEPLVEALVRARKTELEAGGP